MCTVLTVLFSNDKTKSLFTPWKLRLIKWSKYRLGACTDTFEPIVLLKPYFDYCNSFALSLVLKVTTGT